MMKEKDFSNSSILKLSFLRENLEYISNFKGNVNSHGSQIPTSLAGHNFLSSPCISSTHEFEDEQQKEVY